MLRRDLLGPVAALQGVGLPRNQRAVVGLKVLLEDRGLLDRQHDGLRAVGLDHRLVMRRVEEPEFLERHLGEARGELDVDVAERRDGRKIGLVGDIEQRNAVVAGIGDDILYGLQLRQVLARLQRHRQALVVRRQSPRLVARDRPAHRAFAPVVGRQREIPVAEIAMEFFQVVERGGGRGQHVAPSVVPEVLPQPVLLAGRGHELPHARGVGAGVRLRVVGALDHRQQHDLGRHPAALDFLHHVVEKVAAALDHAGDIVRIRHVPLLLAFNQRAVHVGQAEAGADAMP